MHAPCRKQNGPSSRQEPGAPPPPPGSALPPVGASQQRRLHGQSEHKLDVELRGMRMLAHVSLDDKGVKLGEAGEGGQHPTSQQHIHQSRGELTGSPL